MTKEVPGACAHAGNRSVARYYDTSTRRFLAIGGSGAALAIHRPLWADGVTNAQEAADHINTRLASEALRLIGTAPTLVRDLGCGVGGSIFSLARIWPETRFLGITISATQEARAVAEAMRRDLADRCHFLRADYADRIDDVPADLAIAVESHVHAPSVEAFLTAAARHLRPGGALLIVDDMLAQPEMALGSSDKRRLASFRAGWRLGHVPDVDGLVKAANAVGFEHLGTQDFTDLIRLTRLRDIVLRAAGPVAERFRLNEIPFFANIIGGNALTESYRKGTLRYVMVSFQRHAG
jgi:cyclopropane fatty-acyl-phospholipid synthase-like methyltransferase